jgi:hypothetical protein
VLPGKRHTSDTFGPLFPGDTQKLGAKTIMTGRRRGELRPTRSPRSFSLSGPSRKFAQYLVCRTRPLFREGKRAFGVGVYGCVSSIALARGDVPSMLAWLGKAAVSGLQPRQASD